MTPQYSIDENAARSRSRAVSARNHRTKRPALRRSMTTAALCALFGLANWVLVAPTEVSAAPFGFDPFPPGSVVVAQGGTIAGNGSGTTGVEADGAVNVYPPGSSGDVVPAASFANGMAAHVDHRSSSGHRDCRLDHLLESSRGRLFTVLRTRTAICLQFCTPTSGRRAAHCVAIAHRRRRGDSG